MIRGRTWFRLASAVLLLTSVSCAGSPDDEPEARPAGDVVIVEGITVPIDLGASPREQFPGVVSVRMENRGDSMAEIVSLEFISDPGLTAEYLGHTDCNPHCAGGELLTESVRRDVESSIEGQYPIIVEPEGPPVFLVLSLSLSDDGVSKLRRDCVLTVSDVLGEFDDDSFRYLRSSEISLVAGVTLVENSPEGSGSCDADGGERTAASARKAR